MTDLASIATTLLANFATIRIPAQNDAADLSGDWWGAAKVWRTEKRAVRAYRDELRAALVAHGHRQFLDYLEPDPDDGWRLHFFFAEHAALSLLDQITDGRCDAGDPVSFDPEAFVREQLCG
jgi:hypothetical protein